MNSVIFCNLCNSLQTEWHDMSSELSDYQLKISDMFHSGKYPHLEFYGIEYKENDGGVLMYSGKRSKLFHHPAAAWNSGTPFVKDGELYDK